MDTKLSINHFALPGNMAEQDISTGYTRYGLFPERRGDEFMHLQKLPGSRALVIVILLAGLFLVPVAMADVPGAMSYGIRGVSGAVSTEPSLSAGSGQYMLGSISAFGVVHSQSSSSKIDYSQTVSASGKITSFSYSFHYEG